jgi:signal transduction histidine kinase
MRTLFFRLLLWFWLALIVTVGAEIMFEAGARRKDTDLHLKEASGRYSFHADLASEAFGRSGHPGLDSLRKRIESHGTLETFCTDSAGVVSGHVPAPRGVHEAGMAALRSGAGVLVEGPDGAFIGYPIGRDGGRSLAIVLHPIIAPLAGTSFRSSVVPVGRLGWTSILPYDLTLRALIWLVLGGLVCFLLARHITVPVTRLKHATHRLAKGDLSTRVGSRRRPGLDELEDLGQDFDHMAERLEELVSAKERLLGEVSHELRSPLTRLNIALALLRQRNVDDPDGMISRIETETYRLNRMIGDLLTLSRLESGGSGPRLQPLDLGDLVAEIVDDARFEASARRCDVRLTHPGPVPIIGEPGLLRRAVENVVRNAVRHTGEGTTIEITVEQRADAGSPEAVIEVRDHGPGLPEDQLERIFEPFWQADGDRKLDSEGTGLGLPIARRAMVQHGGNLRAVSAPGGGLIVTIRLPVRPAGA